MSRIFTVCFLLLFISCSNNHKENNQAPQVTDIYNNVHAPGYDIKVDQATLSTYASPRRPDDGPYLYLKINIINLTDAPKHISESEAAGVVIIEYNGKSYNYEYSNIVKVSQFDRWDDLINPLTSKTFEVRYKVPLSPGKFYWHSYLMAKNQFVDLAKIPVSEYYR